ncbi:MAG: response regulator [Pseudomonadota bacterium]
MGMHVDNRLPRNLQTDAVALEELFQALLTWLDSVSDGGSAEAGVWFGSRLADPEPGTVVIDAVRQEPPGIAAFPSRGYDLSRLRLTAAALDGTVEVFPPAHGRTQLQIALPIEGVPGSPPIGRVWGEAFAARRALALRDLLLDHSLCVASLRQTGLSVEIAKNAHSYRRRLRDFVDKGETIDFALICRRTAGDETTVLVEETRALCAGPQPQILISGITEITPDLQRAGADGVVRGGAMCRRTLTAMFDLARDLAWQRSGQEIPSFIGRRIMIVEDVAANQTILKGMLAPTGADLVIVDNGLDAVAAQKAEPADLVLMDIRLPEMDGVEASRQIRALCPDCRIIALTANALCSDRERYLKAGMNGYLAKPVMVDALYGEAVKQLQDA